MCDEGGWGTKHGGRQRHGGGGRGRGHGDGGGGGAGEAVRAQAPVYVVSVEKLENIIVNIDTYLDNYLLRTHLIVGAVYEPGEPAAVHGGHADDEVLLGEERVEVVRGHHVQVDGEPDSDREPGDNVEAALTWGMARSAAARS